MNIAVIQIYLKRINEKQYLFSPCRYNFTNNYYRYPYTFAHRFPNSKSIIETSISDDAFYFNTCAKTYFIHRIGSSMSRSTVCIKSCNK